MKKNHPTSIALKKKFGQHFLRDESVVTNMLDAVTLSKNTSVLEIGSGNGFLTHRILKTPIKRLWAFEIDQEWASQLAQQCTDKRLSLFCADFLLVDFESIMQEGMWTVLANLPYYITFPILERFILLKSSITEGVIMIQEEVAQKIVATKGRGYGFISLFFQYHFEWKLLSYIPPSAFVPAPKVHSRLLYFTPRLNPPIIEDGEEFWKFIKVCFKQPRRTLRNNLSSSNYSSEILDEETLNLRAQQLSFAQLLSLWSFLRGTSQP